MKLHDVAHVDRYGTDNGLIKIGGRVWTERCRHPLLVADTLKLRRVLFLACVSFIAPIEVWLLIKAEFTIDLQFIRI